MTNGIVLRRIIALQLLLGLPMIAGARLVLDTRPLRPLAEASGTVETQHGSGCVRLHDHGLCILILRSPWSRAQLTPKLGLFAPVFASPVVKQEDQRGVASVRLRVARSPPTSV